MLVDEQIVMTRPRLKADQRIEPELVMAFIKTARLEVLKDTYAKRGIMDGFFERVRMRIVRDDLIIRLNITEDPTLHFDYPVKEPFFIAPISSVVTFMGYAAIKHLGGVNFTNPFDRISIQEIQTIEASPWTENRPKYSVDMDKVYLSKIPLGMVVVEVDAVFQDPTTMPDYVYDASRFPIPFDYKEKMMYIVKMKLYEHFSIPIDPVNDGMDSTQMRMPKQQSDANG